MDAKGTALLVIDMQNGLFQKSTPVYRAAELLANVNLLIDTFHSLSLPVFFIRHANASSLAEHSPEWELHDALHVQPGDVLLDKKVSNCFKEKAVAEAIKRSGAKAVMVTGLVTYGCVKAACEGALEQGYSVMLPADAHSSFNANAAALVDEWNGKLAGAGVTVLPSLEIQTALSRG